MSLKSQATTIKNETRPAANTTDRVGGLFVDIAEAIESGVLVTAESLSTSNITTTGGNVDFLKGMGNNSANYTYSLYSGTTDELNSADTIESQTLESTGTNVATLAFTGTTGQTKNLNVLLVDPLTSHKRVYKAITATLA